MEYHEILVGFNGMQNNPPKSTKYYNTLLKYNATGASHANGSGNSSIFIPHNKLLDLEELARCLWPVRILGVRV